MSLNLEAKKAIVADVKEIAAQSVSVVAADYRGLTVAEMTELRAQARRNGVVMRVIRNTLARRAVEDTAYACLNEALVGPIVLLFAQNEPSAAARLLRDFVKSHDDLEVRALALEGTLYGAADLEKVASLPTKDEAIAQLMSVLNAPITKLVRTLAEPYAMMARVTAQIRDKKQAA